MSPVKVGLITIGQSPRDDIVPDMVAQLDGPVEVMQRGAVDGMSYEEVCELQPHVDEPWAVSRLQDGTEVRLAKRELDPRMQSCVEDLQDQGAALIVPLCASDWSALRARTGFINPGAALTPVLRAMLRSGGVLGVVSPTEAQTELARSSYAEAGIDVVSTFAQPYVPPDEQHAQCVHAGRLLADAAVDLIYMGCMGHTREMREIVRRESGKPTLTANGIIASLMRQALN